MLHNLKNTQYVADILKGFAENTPTTTPKAPAVRALKSRLYKQIQRLESSLWFPDLMQNALISHGFTLDSEITPTEHGRELLESIRLVLRDYLNAIDPTPPHGIFSTAQAAEYLDIELPTIRRHIYETKLLKGRMVGNSLVFTRSELDTFLTTEQDRKAGRPRKEKA